MEDPSRYWPPDKDFLATRLVEVASKLVALASQYHDALVNHKQAYQLAFITGAMTSVAAGERAGEAASYVQWAAMQDVKCNLIELHHERDLILVLIGLL